VADEITADPVFHRDFRASYPVVVRANGVFLYDETGKAYLDGSSGAIAANLGHGVSQIADAMAEQAHQVAFAHTLRFETPVLRATAQQIAALAPAGLDTVYFASGGSEANESAMKLARQFHRDAGRTGKQLVVGRWQSYHGNTLGALSVGGDVKRRALFSPMLKVQPHVSSPWCAQCPLNSTLDVCRSLERLACVEEIERVVAQVGAENIAAVMVEPIVGSQQGAVVPPHEYLAQVRELCDRHELLLIADEVMTGFGRTGKNFAVEHFDVVPDIITFGKGVTGGYAPLSGMLVHRRIVEAIVARSDGVFRHGYTYSGHPVSLAAGNAALRYYREHRVLDNAVAQGVYLRGRLDDLHGRHPMMGQVRGAGLLLAFDILQVGESQVTSEQLNAVAMSYGAVFYPGSGALDGVRGQHLLVAPPLTIASEEVDLLVDVLDRALSHIENGDPT
jgi:adenosylmethionine-8-amino-7-oxononanoate aminotransferase